MNSLLSLTGSFLLTTSMALAAGFTGSITFEQKQNARTESYLYQVTEKQAKLSRLGKVIPSPPINLHNFENGDISILYPHNGTWMLIPKAKKTAQTPAGFPNIPQMPGIPQMNGIPTPQGNQHPNTSNQIGPDSSQLPALPNGAPAVPSMPTMPQRPAMPTPPSGMPAPHSGMEMGMPAGMPGMHGAPSMPTIPDFPGFEKEKSIELTAGEETRTILGYSCTQYTLTIPREGGSVTLWLSNDKSLPPFHPLLHEAPNERDLKSDWQQRLPSLLREKNLFPFEVVHASNDGKPLYQIKVLELNEAPIKENTFTVPAHFHQLEPPRF